MHGEVGLVLLSGVPSPLLCRAIGRVSDRYDEQPLDGEKESRAVSRPHAGKSVALPLSIWYPDTYLLPGRSALDPIHVHAFL